MTATVLSTICLVAVVVGLPLFWFQMQRATSLMKAQVIECQVILQILIIPPSSKPPKIPGARWLKWVSVARGSTTVRPLAWPAIAVAASRGHPGLRDRKEPTVHRDGLGSLEPTAGMEETAATWQPRRVPSLPARSVRLPLPAHREILERRDLEEILGSVKFY